MIGVNSTGVDWGSTTPNLFFLGGEGLFLKKVNKQDKKLADWLIHHHLMACSFHMSPDVLSDQSTSFFQ